MLKSCATTLMAVLFAVVSAIPAAAVKGQSDKDDPRVCRKVDAGRVKVPADFEIFVGSSPGHAWRSSGWQIRVFASGKVETTTKRRDSEGKRETVKNESQVSEAGVRKIYATVLACNFFALYESYRKPGVRSGNARYVGVIAGGRTQTTNVVFLDVERFDTIMSTVHKVVEGEAD